MSKRTVNFLVRCMDWIYWRIPTIIFRPLFIVLAMGVIVTLLAAFAALAYLVSGDRIAATACLVFMVLRHSWKELKELHLLLGKMWSIPDRKEPDQDEEPWRIKERS